MEEQAFTGHTGNLEIDAPGLFGDLARLFGKEHAQKLASVYLAAFSYRKSGDEIELQRLEGANFNPFPARVAAILLKEKLLDPTLCMVCFCFPFVLPEYENEVATTITGALEFLEAPKATVGEAIERVALAVLLDRVRHLHMSQLDLAAQRQLYRFTLEQVVPVVSYESHEGLKKMLESWGQMVKSRYT